MHLVEWLMIFAILIFAVCLDLRRRKIPNSLNFGFMLIGLMVALVKGGITGMFNSLIWILVLMACLIPLFAFGVIGAGDIKLLGALGSFLGINVFWIVIYSFLSCAIYGLILVVTKVKKAGVGYSLLKIKAKDYKCTRVAFSVFILFGVIMYLVRNNA